MRVEFWYVRHGQTLFNVLGRLQGWCDSPLTEKGIADAEKAEQALKGIPFDKAWSSPSPRAVKTARIILRRHNAVLKTHEDLKEFDYGLLDGTKTSELPEKDLKIRRIFGSWNDVQGEDSKTISLRIHRCFDEIIRRCRNGDKVLIVSHGTYALFLMRDLLGIDLNEYRNARTDTESKLFPNGGIMKFVYEDGEWRMDTAPCRPEQYGEN
ncbi:MAG: histidine phosphatase family protein [Solobacterium sp.]|nr:histidine phosphatase family protein [Solobacterium sp.]